MTDTTPLHFNAFLMNTASHIHYGQWRRSDAGQTNFNDLNFWLDLAQELEEARFDAMFFADVVGHYGDTDGDYSVYAREGLQLPSNDPTVLLGALAAVTKHIGLATTSNVAQNPPFNFARQLSTLDHMSGGRIAWNIVTGTQENGARNFGMKRLTEHAERYRWAEEYLEVVYKLWEGSWEEGALLRDPATHFADPERIHKIHHHGPRYSVEGPHLPSPSPQRTPLLFQAGASPTGRAFAARNAEAVFIIAASPEEARFQVEQTRQLALEYGRDPQDIKFFQGMSFVVGETQEQARLNAEYLDRYASIEGYLAHSTIVDEAGRSYAPDTPLSAVRTNTQKGFQEVVARGITDREPTVRDLGLHHARGLRFVGTPESIADRLEEWRNAGIDGINLNNYVLPGTYREFAHLVMPVLRERGLAQEQYQEGTLRRKLFGSDHLNERHPATQFRGAFKQKRDVGVRETHSGTRS